MTVAVLCDSTAALEPATAARFGVAVVPMVVVVGGRQYADGELSDSELEARLDGGLATTSAPSPGAWLESVQEHAGPDGAVAVSVAARLSGSGQAARLAGELADVPVRVVDSGTAAGAEALVVLAAARAARAGGSVDEVAAAAERAADQVRLVGTLSSLDRLVAGGRVPGIAASAGRRFGVQPVFELRAGRVRPLLPAFSRAAALDRLVATWLAGRPRDGATCEVVISHALADDDAAALLERVRAEAGPEVGLVGRFGVALLAHAGPGTIGLSWIWHGGPAVG